MLKAVVSADTVDVRTGRSRFFSRLGLFLKGDVVTVLDDGLNTEYVMAIWKTGYAYSAKGTYINLIDSGRGIQDHPNAVVSDNISVRKGRGINYVKLGVFGDGETITALEDPMLADYIKVAYEIGYVHADKGQNLRLESEPPPASDTDTTELPADEETEIMPNAVVKANAISVRTGRGQDYDKLGEFVRDDQIVVLDDTLAYTYAHVIWRDGDGYAYCDYGRYIHFIYVPPEEGLNAVVTAGRISVREGRAESFPKLGEFVRGDQIIVRDDTLAHNYVHVVFNDTEGYAYCDYGKYIRLLSDIPAYTDTNAVVTANRISVREGRGLEYTKLGEFKKGDQIIVLDDILDYDYVHVVWEKTTGYAYCDFGQYIRFTDEQQTTDECRATEPNAIVTAGTISIREGRGAEYPIIGEYTRGDTITVLDETLDYEYVQVVCDVTLAYAYCDYGNNIRFLSAEIPEDVARTLDIIASCVDGKYIYGGQGKKITGNYVRRQQSRYPEYFTGGRFEFLLNIGRKCDADGKWRFPNDYCWDCSGLWWYAANKAGIYGKNIDTTANTFYHNYCVPIDRDSLNAGDAVFYRNSAGRITHMGIVGRDGVVYEAMSGYVGVIAGDSVDDRTAPRIVGSGSLTRRTWNAFGRPKIFIE